jgi:hypothetical protein
MHWTAYSSRIDGVVDSIIECVRAELHTQSCGRTPLGLRSPSQAALFTTSLSRCWLQDTAFPDAFKWAHEADPDAQLCINDLSLIEAHNSEPLIRIIKEHVWAHGAPIHCIGIQVCAAAVHLCLGGCQKL